ncbi:MAG: putative porin [Pseudomonadales bacterium]|nr:putative porin [Pseudomonadales bacterium]
MSHLKQLVLVAFLSMFLFSPISYADQSYQAEIMAGYEKEDTDSSTYKAIGLLTEIYFSPVNTENKPLTQAAFLDKKSSVVVGYISAKTDLQNSSVDSIDLGGPLIALNYITETGAFILGAGYSNLDGDTNPDVLTIESRIIGFTIGKYINDSTTVKASYTNGDTEYRSTTTSQIFTVDTDYYELTYNTVQNLGATNYYSFGIGFELIKKDSSDFVKENNNELKVSGSHYFSRMTSLGLAALFNSGDDISDEGQALAVSLTHFIAPQIAIEIGLSKFNADNNTEDADSISFDVIARI